MKVREFELDSFTVQYIVTMLWAENDWSTPAGGEPLDDNYSIEDLSDEALASCIEDCKDFQQSAEWQEAIQTPGTVWYEDNERGGHDFWLTRNGHGAGFWCRHMDEPGHTIGKKLTEFSKPYGTVNPIVGDDGSIYLG